MLWEVVNNEDNCAMDCTSFEMVNRAVDKGVVHRTLICDDVAMEAMELSSFYESSRTRNRAVASVSVSAGEFMGLLSPERSPDHNSHYHSQLIAKRLSPLLALKTTSPVAAVSEPPPRSFRNFNSLSSERSSSSSSSSNGSNGCSAECNNDDEYMELFEIESLHAAQQPQGALFENANFGFPSNLNTLISGRIKGNSPKNVAAARTPAPQRLPVRRCLSLTESALQEQQQQQQQKTPLTPKTVTSALDELFKRTTPLSTRLPSNIAPDFVLAASFKRPEPPSLTNSPALQRYKRHCSIAHHVLPTVSSASATKANKENGVVLAAKPNRQAPPLRKCMSMNDAEIMSALARSDNRTGPELIGDFSKVYALPLIDGRHQDLKSISSDTVARLLNGDFADKVADYKIIDCRYPYEYEGGHIRGAVNLYTQEQIIDELLACKSNDNEKEHNDNGNGNDAGVPVPVPVAVRRRNVLIFHCEFSSERGPRMSRFLRNLDRERNTNIYPVLDYPEIYLLHNGYKDFYETHGELCNPNGYRPMLEPAYNDAYRHFRAKSKSWNGDSASTIGRPKKSRSRLML